MKITGVNYKKTAKPADFRAFYGFLLLVGVLFLLFLGDALYGVGPGIGIDTSVLDRAPQIYERSGVRYRDW